MIEHLDTFHDAFAEGDGTAVVVGNSHSLWWHFPPVADFDTWLQKINPLLAARGQGINNGEGWRFTRWRMADNDLFSKSWTVAGTSTMIGGSVGVEERDPNCPAGFLTRITANGTPPSYTGIFDGVKWLVRKKTNGATLAPSISNEAALPTVPTSGSGFAWLDSGRLSHPFQHTFTVTNTDGVKTGDIVGAHFGRSGLRLVNLSHDGWAFTHFLRNTATWDAIQAIADAGDLDGIVIELGIGTGADADHTRSNADWEALLFQTLTRAMAYGVSVLYVFPPAFLNGVDWAGKEVVARETCRRMGVGFLSWFENLGDVRLAASPYNLGLNDGHVNEAGQTFYAQLMAEAMTGGQDVDALVGGS